MIPICMYIKIMLILRYEKGDNRESIRPSSDLRNRYQELSSRTGDTGEPIFITVNGHEDTVLMGHAQYGKMKSELELLNMLVETQDDVDDGRTAPIQDTFDDIRKALLARKYK